MLSKRGIRNKLLLLLGALASSCVSNASAPASDLNESSLVVVERSKAEPPVWVKSVPGQVQVEAQDLRIMTARTKLLNLPLGLKQTQLVGLDTARSALAAWLGAQLAAANKGEDLPSPHPDLDRVLLATVDGPAGAKLKINDLYYEALNNLEAPPGDLLAHYYSVYILVAYPKDKLPYLFHDLAGRLAASPVPYVRRLAAVTASLEHRAP